MLLLVVLKLRLRLVGRCRGNTLHLRERQTDQLCTGAQLGSGWREHIKVLPSCIDVVERLLLLRKGMLCRLLMMRMGFRDDCCIAKHLYERATSWRRRCYQGNAAASYSIGRGHRLR
uniref:Putative secreted protein n=1 Tax=Anopheles triannulatus TaxID=58253 RepID=A0A2M4B3J1_9DIPT